MVVVHLIDSLLLAEVDYRRQFSTLVVAPYHLVGFTRTDTTRVAGLFVTLYPAGGATLGWNDPHVEIRNIIYVPRRGLSLRLTAYPSRTRHTLLAYYAYRNREWVREGLY